MSESGLIPDDRQTRLASWLAEKRPDLASMYRTARDLLATAAKPGDERTRVSVSYTHLTLPTNREV